MRENLLAASRDTLPSEGSYVALLNLKDLLNRENNFRIPIANEADGYRGLGFDI